MAKGGKTGGGGGGLVGVKGGGGKGGGSKGKKGGCAPGDIVNCALTSTLFQTIQDAFNQGVTSGTDKVVRFECTVAQKLLFAVATSMTTSFSKAKGKKGGK